VLNSKNFGVPQNRERVFIVGHLRGESRPKVFPVKDASKVCNKRNENKETICQTIKARYPADWNGNYIEGERIRRLTPIECERLQGFPDGWTSCVSDSQRYKCLGNAVTVNVIEYIASKLIK